MNAVDKQLFLRSSCTKRSPHISACLAFILRTDLNHIQPLPQRFFTVSDMSRYLPLVCTTSTPSLSISLKYLLYLSNISPVSPISLLYLSNICPIPPLYQSHLCTISVQLMSKSVHIFPMFADCLPNIYPISVQHMPDTYACKSVLIACWEVLKTFRVRARKSRPTICASLVSTGCFYVCVCVFVSVFVRVARCLRGCLSPICEIYYDSYGLFYPVCKRVCLRVCQ